MSEATLMRERRLLIFARGMFFIFPSISCSLSVFRFGLVLKQTLSKRPKAPHVQDPETESNTQLIIYGLWSDYGRFVSLFFCCLYVFLWTFCAYMSTSDAFLQLFCICSMLFCACVMVLHLFMTLK